MTAFVQLFVSSKQLTHMLPQLLFVQDAKMPITSRGNAKVKNVAREARPYISCNGELPMSKW